MDHPSVPVAGISEWLPAHALVRPAPAWRALWLIPVVLAGAIVAVVTGLAGGVLAAVVAAVVLWAWISIQGRLALRALSAIRVGSQQAPRLFNLAEGLALTAGIPMPSLWLIPDGGPNALVCRLRGPVVAISRSLLDGYTRTELEAVVAHCFVRLPSARALSAAVALGSLGDKIVPSVGFLHDAAAAALTRYPPAMASAIAKAQPRSDRFSAFWFVGDDAFHDPESARTEMLLDL
ncbi:MAG: hypothetical protein M3P01_08740 [Actinomycetota bacterium]|nr:hypothetical protein [Actinomycetota bacterium]